MTFNNEDALELAKSILVAGEDDNSRRKRFRTCSDLWRFVDKNRELLIEASVVAALCLWPLFDQSHEKVHAAVCPAAWRLYAQQPDHAAFGRVCKADQNGRYASVDVRRQVFEIWLARQRFDLLAECGWAVLRQNARRVVDAGLAHCEAKGGARGTG